MTLTIENNVDSDSGKGIGSRFPCRLPVGARNVKFAGNLYFEDDTEYQKYWGAATGPSDDGMSDEEIVITIDSGTDGSIEFKIPKAVYNSLATPPSGREEIIQAFTGEALVEEVTLADAVTKINTELLVTIESNNDDMDDDISS